MAIEGGSARPLVAVACAECHETAGSVASVALHQARELARAFDVALVSDRMPAALPEGVTGVPVAERRYTFLRRFAHVPAQWSFARRVGRRLLRLHRDRPVAAVICHSHALAVAGALRLRRRTGVPFALVTHGDIFDRPPGSYDPRLTRFFRRMTPPAYRESDRILALSPYMEELARRGGAAPERIRLTPNGIDPADVGIDLGKSRFDAAPRDPKAPLRVVYVGQLGAPKGVDVLVAAASRLAEGGVDFTLDLIGDGPLRGELETRAGGAGLAGRVRFRGSRPRRELGAVYSAADVAVVPSRSEPLATVVLEALVAECPVVASDAGGNPSMVRDGENGLLVPVGDAEALAAALVRLAGDRATLERLARGARPSVWPAYSWRERGGRLVDVMGELMAERSAA